MRKVLSTVRRLTVLCLTLVMLVSFSSLALGEAQIQDSYMTIWELYDEAFLRGSEFDLDFALTKMKELIEIYESSDSRLADYSNAQMYYKYAKGAAAFQDEQYEEAEKWMTDCALADTRSGYDPANYIAFAKGMTLKKRGEYKDAIAMLSGVTGLADYTGRRLEAISQCRQMIRETNLTLAKTAIAGQDYQLATDLCDEILKYVSNDEEALALREQARKAGGFETAARQEFPITITSAKTTGTDSVSLSWEGTPETYTVIWTPDLVRGGNAQSATVEGHEYTVTGLYPGTVYRFTVEYQGNQSPSKDKKTNAAEEFMILDSEGNQKKMRTGTCVIYDYEDAREDYADQDIPVYQYREQQKLKAQRDKVLHLDGIENDLILFAFTNFPYAPEDIAEKEYALLLHAEGLETLIHTGRVGDESVTGNPDTGAKDYSIYVTVSDLLDTLTGNYTMESLAKKAYTLDLLIEGKMAGSVSGTLE